MTNPSQIVKVRHLAFLGATTMQLRIAQSMWMIEEATADLRTQNKIIAEVLSHEDECWYDHSMGCDFKEDAFTDFLTEAIERHTQGRVPEVN